MQYTQYNLGCEDEMRRRRGGLPEAEGSRRFSAPGGQGRGSEGWSAQGWGATGCRGGQRLDQDDDEVQRRRAYFCGGRDVGAGCDQQEGRAKGRVWGETFDCDPSSSDGTDGRNKSAKAPSMEDRQDREGKFNNGTGERGGRSVEEEGDGYIQDSQYAKVG
jgi:hypothetical protein